MELLRQSLLFLQFRRVLAVGSQLPTSRRALDARPWNTAAANAKPRTGKQVTEGAARGRRRAPPDHLMYKL